MNITIISLEYPPEPGGIGEYAYQIANKLSNYNHNILAVIYHASTSESEYAEFAKNQNYQISRLNGYNGRTSFLLKKIFLFKKFIKDHKTDLLIVVSPTAGLIGRIIKKVYRIPYFIVGHGSEFLQSNKVHQMLIKYCYNRADLVLPNSNYTLSLLQDMKIKNNNIQVLYPGADEQLYDYKKYPNRQAAGKKILLTVGALSPRKGHKHVLDALSLIDAENLNFEYWIIGRGSDENNLKQYISKRGLDNKVKILGFVPREDLPEYYSKADIFVLTSSDVDATQVEGFGIVLVEANLMKKPVIGSKNTGMEEIIVDGSNGLLVDPKDSIALADALKSLMLDNKKALDMGENGFKHAREKFTWAKFGEKLNTMIAKQFD